MFDWSYLAGTALTTLGGLLDDSASDAAASQERWSQRSYDLAWDSYTQGIRRKVKDAKAAGIHPLYALGAQTSSPSFSAGVAPRSGSALGGALEQIGGMLSRMRGSGDARAQEEAAVAEELEAMNRRQVSQAQVRSLDASAARDSAEAQLALTRAKMAEQSVLNVRAAGDGTGKKIPVAFSPGISSPGLGDPTGNENQAHPMWVQVVRPDGSIGRVLNPDTNMDEINQAIYIADEVAYGLRPYGEKLGEKTFDAVQYIKKFFRHGNPGHSYQKRRYAQ